MFLCRDIRLTFRPGVVVSTVNPGTREPETEGSLSVDVLLGLQSKAQANQVYIVRPCFKNNNKKNIFPIDTVVQTND